MDIKIIEYAGNVRVLLTTNLPCIYAVAVLYYRYYWYNKNSKVYTEQEGKQMYSDIHMKCIVDLLIERVNAYLIILFGSYGKGLSREDSDIDIAYLGDKDCDGYEIFMLAQEMAGLVGRDVDLLNLRTASTVMKAQVVSSGKVIYCSDEMRRMHFFMETFKEYTRLNEERAVVLREIERQGSVYGN